MSNFMRVEKIDQELNSIFESPEILSVQKHRELNLIQEQIDKIYMRNSLSQVESIYRQMNDIYKSETITKNQEQTLELLNDRLNELFINKSKADISPKDEQMLEVLNTKIDALYETKEPTIEEIEKAETLLYEKETLYAAIFMQQGQLQPHLC